MTRVLKPGRSGVEKASDAQRVKATVEGILAEIEARGDAAVRDGESRPSGSDLLHCLNVRQEVLEKVLNSASQCRR